MPGSVSNFLGGSPLSVIVRLAILSLLVGILMSWFDIRPVEVVDWVVDFGRYLWNSVFVTVTATLITLVVNSMAAFALSKYEFRGRTLAMLVILATLMVPLSVIMVPLYSIISSMGLFNNLWGVILPTVATPTGVFILRDEPEQVASRVLGKSVSGTQRMAYVLDLTRPNGLFLARDFLIRDEDTVYVTEAPYVQWQKRLAALIGPINSANSIQNLSN